MKFVILLFATSLFVGCGSKAAKPDKAATASENPELDALGLRIADF